MTHRPTLPILALLTLAFGHVACSATSGDEMISDGTAGEGAGAVGGGQIGGSGGTSIGGGGAVVGGAAGTGGSGGSGGGSGVGGTGGSGVGGTEEGGAAGAGGSGGTGSGAGGDAAGGGGTSTGGEATGGIGAAGTGGSGGSAGGSAGGSGGSTGSTALKVMSLNIYGHATMPGAAGTYAGIVNANGIDVLGIQEGVQDWLIGPVMPTDYSRADALGAALGGCWEHRYQIFVNTCQGASFVSNTRFDLTDGPNATRTGELAVISKGGQSFAFINIHWDHESATTRAANASETAAAANQHTGIPTIVLGDFNSGCTGGDVSSMASQGGMSLIADAGIDCILTRSAAGTGSTLNAAPSDHPGVFANLTL